MDNRKMNELEEQVLDQVVGGISLPGALKRATNDMLTPEKLGRTNVNHAVDYLGTQVPGMANTPAATTTAKKIDEQLA